MEKLIILGAGVAGLSCQNALLDKNISSLLIEAKSVGTPKICGEFLAPMALHQLNRWHIEGIQPINEVIFFCKQQKLSIPFPKSSGAIARNIVELQLMQRAIKLGATIRENTEIETIIPPQKNHPYVLQLTTGEEIQTEHVIFATGKIRNQNKSLVDFPYVGIKMHINHIVKPHALLMFSERNTYFGLVPVSEKLSNFACLVKKTEIKKYGCAEDYFNHLAKHNSYLRDIFEKRQLEKIDWMDGFTPEFQRKKLPEWPQSLWIGDATVALPPASGSGFAHGIQSGVMAAEFYAQKNFSSYQKKSAQIAAKKLFYGRLLHQLFLNPMLGTCCLPLIKSQPFLAQWLLKKLDFI